MISARNFCAPITLQTDKSFVFSSFISSGIISPLMGIIITRACACYNNILFKILDVYFGSNIFLHKTPHFLSVIRIMNMRSGTTACYNNILTEILNRHFRCNIFFHKTPPYLFIDYKKRNTVFHCKKNINKLCLFKITV